jgi:hypothetical protein
MTKHQPPKTVLTDEQRDRATEAAHRAQKAIAPGAGRCSSCDAEVWRLHRPSTIAGDPPRIVMFEETTPGEGGWKIAPDDGTAIYVGNGKGYMTAHSCVSGR